MNLLVENIRKVAGPELINDTKGENAKSGQGSGLPFQPIPISYNPPVKLDTEINSTHTASPQVPRVSGPLAVESLLKTGIPYPVRATNPSDLYDDVTKHAKEQCAAVHHPRLLRCAIMTTARDLEGLYSNPNFDDKFKEEVEKIRKEDFGKAENKISELKKKDDEALKKKEDELEKKVRADIDQYNKEIVKAKENLEMLKTAQQNRILELEKEAGELKEFVKSLEDSYRKQVLEEARQAQLKAQEEMKKQSQEAPKTQAPPPTQLPPIHEQPKPAEPLPNIPLGKPGDALVQEEKKMKEAQSNPGEVIVNMHRYLING